MALFSPFCYEMYAEVALHELASYLKNLTSQLLTLIMDLLTRINLCTAASRASSLAAKWCWLYDDDAQYALFCFVYVLWYT